MNFDHSNTSANDIPNAESTKIEKSAKTPLKRLRHIITSRMGLYSNPNSPSGTPQTRKNSTSIATPTLSKLDPQVYLDTQSNGFASRVVKYHDASVAKSRNITNKVYRRPGDFPIVNLDKSEINLNKKKANTPTVSKINIAPPINLVSASNVSERSTIFRTGKNYGESYPIGKLGPIEARKLIKTIPTAHSSKNDEPIVPTNNDYDSAPIRSSLEALKEISRKRINCDELDGDINKKQRADNDYEQNNAQVANTSKRTRDRTSPSFSSSAAEMQQKRYRNNDILSSLSSSILMSTPKRSALNTDVTASKIRRPEFNYDRHNANESELTDSFAISNCKSGSSRVVGMSKSDLPLHHPSEPIKPVIKSMSDGYDQKSLATKTNKLTLFNKVYSVTQSTNEKKKPNDDDDENSITFVKPKAKASSIFSVNKNRDQKSKLAMMLSFLRGDESKDEVDSVVKPVIDSEKSNQKEEPKPEITSSTLANLNTTTSVTFSTATTTSLLNVPSDVTKPSISEPQKAEVKTPTVATKPIVSSATPLISLSSTAITTTLQNGSPKVSTGSAIKPTVTFSLPATTAATSTATTSASDSTNRLGGFSFSTTPTALTSSLVAKPTSTEILSIAKAEENKSATPSFSFGLTKSTTNTTTLPSFTPPTFGSNSLPAKTESTTVSTQSSIVSTSSTPVTFNFGSPANTIKPESNTSSASTPAFAFGTTTPTTDNRSLLMSTGLTTSTTTSVSPVFGTSNTVTASTNVTPIQNQTPSPAFSFGGTSNVVKPQTDAFQFGKTTTSVATPSVFGSPSVSTPLFGSTTTSSITSTTPKTPKFAFTASKPGSTNAFTNVQSPISFNATSNPTSSSTAAPSLFGSTNASASSTVFGGNAFSSPSSSQQTPLNTAQPVFGSGVFAQPATAPTTTATTTNLFGNAQNTSVFPASNLQQSTATQPKTENVFGAASNQTTNTTVFGSQNQNQSNTFGKSSSMTAFGSNNNLFGSTQSNAQSQPPQAFGTSNNLFSTQTTSANLNQSTNSAFGQTTTQQNPATTASTGIFGTSNTNANAIAPFVFGQGNSTTPNQQSGIFGSSKTVENSLTAPPAFGSTSPAFNFTAKPTFGNPSETKPPAFPFNTPNNNTTAAPSVPAFGSNSATQPFGGATNGIGSSFAFGTTNNQPEAAKPFNFGGPSTAPAAPAAPFSFNTPSPAPAQNAFQFNPAPQQPVATNMFSIGPGSSTTKTGRPMRTATRRMK